MLDPAVEARDLGQDAGREMRSVQVQVPPRTRVIVEADLFSVAYVHSRTQPEARIGLHSPAIQEIHLIQDADWGNIWVYGLDILLAGYLTHEEFSRNATSILPGSRVFQYDKTQVKNLAVSVSNLRPLSELFEHTKAGSVQRMDGNKI